MKHQVFFFLLILSCSEYAMDKNAQKIGRIIERCRHYNKYTPNTYNVEQLEANKGELLKLPEAELKMLLKQANHYVPKFVEENDRGIVFDWKISNEKNEFTGIDTFY